MLFRQLFDAETATYTYLLADEKSGDAVLIDPVLEQVERDTTLLRELGLTLRYALDTHVHADHVTALGTLRERTGCQTVLSERAGTGCADVLVKHGDLVRFGAHALEVRETPGHTDGCVSYVSADQRRVFTGDALLIRGCGRTDFQQGSAATLYRSVHEQLFSLPDATEVYPGHDYKGRTVTTVGEEKAHNPRLGGGRTSEDFVALMSQLALAYPKKIDVALPANLQCGVPRGLPVDPAQSEAEPTKPTHPWEAPVQWSAGGIPEVEPAWVAARQGAYTLLDVREPQEFVGELGRVAGAALLPLGGVREAYAGRDRQKEQAVVLLCRSGGRSGKAALALLAMGFTQVASMRGGMLAWNAQGLPTERGAPG